MLLISIVFYSFGCFTQTHIVGKGAQSSQVLEQRQWYILWGLVPLNTVDSHSMTGGSANYTIQTSHTFIDWAISIFTSIATIYPATVKVMK
ncbi:MAG: hypothetical protein AB9882_14810 [Ignavibacteriaceae bacterium]